MQQPTLPQQSGEESDKVKPTCLIRAGHKVRSYLLLIVIGGIGRLKAQPFAIFMTNDKLIYIHTHLNGK